MDKTLDDLISVFLGGGSVISAGRDYALKSVTFIDDHTGNGWKATIKNESYSYRSIEFGKTKEDAVILTLKTLQSMGKFGEFKSKSADSVKIKPKKKDIDHKPISVDIDTISKVDTTSSKNDMNIDISVDSIDVQKQSPNEIELSTILRIISA